MRREGSRNTNYDMRRVDLLDKIKRKLIADAPRRTTLRDMAAVCDCSVSTLRHYFGRRDDIIEAIFERTRDKSSPHLDRISSTDLPFDASVCEVVRNAWTVLDEFGAVQTLAMGMAEGLNEQRLGASYLNDMFDPFVRALQQRLDGHVARHEMRAVDTRLAAMNLASPLLMVALHQNGLQGDTVWRLDKGDFLDHLIASFQQAYAIPENDSASRPTGAAKNGG